MQILTEVVVTLVLILVLLVIAMSVGSRACAWGVPIKFLVVTEDHVGNRVAGAEVFILTRGLLISHSTYSDPSAIGITTDSGEILVDSVIGWSTSPSIPFASQELKVQLQAVHPELGRASARYDIYDVPRARSLRLSFPAASVERRVAD